MRRRLNRFDRVDEKFGTIIWLALRAGSYVADESNLGKRREK